MYQRYKSSGEDTIILAGAEYGSGSSRDWAAKGPMLQVLNRFSRLFSHKPIILFYLKQKKLGLSGR